MTASIATPDTVRSEADAGSAGQPAPDTEQGPHRFSDQALVRCLLGLQEDLFSTSTPPPTPLPLSVVEEQGKDLCNLKIVGPDNKTWLVDMFRAKVWSSYFKNALSEPTLSSLPRDRSQRYVVDLSSYDAVLIDRFVGYLWRGSYIYETPLRLRFVEGPTKDQPCGGYDSKAMFHLDCHTFSDVMGCPSFGVAALTELRGILKLSIEMGSFVNIVAKVFKIKVDEENSQVKKMIATHGVFFHQFYSSQGQDTQYHSVFEMPAYGRAFSKASTDVYAIFRTVSQLPRTVVIPKPTEAKDFPVFPRTTPPQGHGIPSERPTNESHVNEGDLFRGGVSPHQPAPRGLFGNGPSTSTGGNLFGGASPQRPAPRGLFETGPSTDTGGGLFGGGASPRQATSGGLFGNTRSTNATGGLFRGESNARQPASGGGLFGTSSGQTPSDRWSLRRRREL